MNNVIRIKDRGSFHIGGEKIKIEDAPVEEFNYMDKFTYSSDPNGTHWAKQMYVQYSIIDGLKAPYPILMWHGGGLTGVTWETTPDGREGWDTLFLRYGYDVYVSDAVERGRSSWAKFPEVNETPPIFHSYEGRWLNLKMGEVYPTPYEGLRFPVEYYDNLMKQSVPRLLLTIGQLMRIQNILKKCRKRLTELLFWHTVRGLDMLRKLFKSIKIL